MKQINRAELVYRGFDPAFEELVGFWGTFYKLKIKYSLPIWKGEVIENAISVESTGHKGTLTKRLNRLVKTIRAKKVRGKRKEFTIWRGDE